MNNSITLVFLVLILAHSISDATAQQHVVVRKPSEGRGFMAPNNGGIWSWGDEILVMYVNAPHKDGTGCGSHSAQGHLPGTTYDVSRSLDGGLTWQDHQVAFKRYTKSTGYPDPQPRRLETPLDFTDPVHFQRDDEGSTFIYYSEDRGKNWLGPFNNIPKFLNGVNGRTNYEVTGPKSMTAYMAAVTIDTDSCKRYDSYEVITQDGGLSWQLGAKINQTTDCEEGKRIEWDGHPSVARVDAETLIASFRSGNQGEKVWTRTGWFDVSRSLDNGKTWSYLTRLGESPGNNSCPTSTNVLTREDGTKQIVTIMWLRPPDKNACENAKLIARVSDDQGDSWSEMITLRDDAFGWDTGYPIATVNSQGQVVICYWMKTENQDEPNYIAVTVWNPKEVDP